jgi:hypothetical protein
MKQQQKFITTLGLIVALSSLSPVMAADVGSTSGGEAKQASSTPSESHKRYQLSTPQMDKIHGGQCSCNQQATPTPSICHGGVCDSIVPGLKAYGCSQGIQSWC